MTDSSFMDIFYIEMLSYFIAHEINVEELLFFPLLNPNIHGKISRFNRLGWSVL